VQGRRAVTSPSRGTRGALLLLALSLAGFDAAGQGKPGLPLIDAVKRGDHASVRSLVRDRSAVNMAEADGTTALHLAVQDNDIELVRILLRAGANAKATNRYGITPLVLAATNGSPLATEALLAAGADANSTGAGNEPVLLTAARTGNADTIRRLLTRGANVNVTEPWFGETALMWAASQNHASAVRLLVESGAQINAKSTVMAAPVLEFPRSGGPNSPLPRGGWTPLMFAAREGAIDAARALAELGADLNATALPETDVPMKPEEVAASKDGVGTSALVFAIINSHFDLAALLLEKGANPNVTDVAGTGALYAAVDMNSMQWTQGRPAPYFTDRLDAIDLVKLLLTRGADPNARLKRQPLKRHHDAGTTLNLGAGATPLIRAAKTNDVASMKALLDAGANPFLTLADRTDALMVAAGLGYGGLRGEAIRIVIPTSEGAVEAVKLLLDHGMDVDAFNTAGNTALHGAVTRGDAVVKYLASRGATLNVKNRAGLMPLDLAKGAGGRGGRGGVVRESTAALLTQLMQEAERGRGAGPVQ
jgi:ankyrin repeat protein